MKTKGEEEGAQADGQVWENNKMRQHICNEAEVWEAKNRERKQKVQDVEPNKH